MSRFQVLMVYALFVTAATHGVPCLTNAQEVAKNENSVRKFFAQQRQAYESAKTLKDAVTIAKQRLVDQGLAEYVGIIDENRIEEAIRNSVEWYDKKHSRNEKRAQRSETPQDVKDVVSKTAKHFRDTAKPQYEGITADNKWPAGAYFLIRVGDTPNFNGLTIDLVIDTRDVDGIGVELAADLPAITIHKLEILELNYGKTLIPEDAEDTFRALSAIR